MRKTILMTIALVCMAVQGAWAYDWDGSGTLSDPYLIKDELDWYQLASECKTETFSGVYFRQTRDIPDIHSMVGTESTPFAGIYDGDGHYLDVKLDYDGAYTAPFHYVGGATIRHLHIKGTITGKLHTSGLIGACQGGTNTIEDCHVSATITEKENTLLRAGGFIGHGSEAENKLSDCLFDGTFKVVTYVTDCYFAPFIGWSTYTTADRQSITNCLENGNYEPPCKRQLYFAYSASDGKTDNPITLDRCYSMQGMTVAQGIPVFDSVTVPDGCTYKFVSDPTVQFAGKSYWTTGATIDITVPEGTPFNHWSGLAYPGIFVSDCFKASGKHTLQDVVGKPILTIQTNPIPEPETERTEWGVTYRYLSRQDYHYYFSDETVTAKGWHFENGDVKTDDNSWDDNLLLYNADGDASELTVITGYDESDYNDDGVQIHNDLVGDVHNHTHLAMIAPRAFNNSSALKTLYFKDTDANNYNTLTPFDFEIGNEAFANCPNLTEIKMMQYTTKGDNHWEKLDPTQVTKIGYDVFLGSPNAKVSTRRDVYQDYLSSATWKDNRSRIIIYDATVEDFTVNGVKYHKFRNNDETVALTNNEKDQMMDNHVRIWNADYQQFSAATLLDTKDGATVYYTYVVGVDDDDIDDAGGVMRIYNDPGSYYNYKTLALGRTAIAGNEHVKTIEFYQTNGNSDNSYSDLKFVIQNGALKGCKNLKELRLFYYVEEGEDHWETLGPQDVIPGSNIFGLTRDWDGKISSSSQESNTVPPGFKILVSPSRYREFLDDPNWMPYIPFIEPVEFDPQNQKKDFTHGGLTYGYAAAPGGIMQTSQTVSQDVSWWTAPRIAAEVAIMLASLGSGASASSGTKALSTEFEAARVAYDAALENEISGAAVYNSIVAAQQSLTATPEAMAHAVSALTDVINMPNANNVFDLFSDNIIQMYIHYGILNANGLLHESSSDAFIQFIEETYLQAGSAQTFVNRFLRNVISTYLEPVGTVCTMMAEQREAAWSLMLQASASLIKSKAKDLLIHKLVVGGIYSAAATTSAMIATNCWGPYNGDALQKGMRANILSNIHQVGLVGGGYVITTPSKNLIYHNYIKSVDDNLQNAVIYAGFDDDGNSHTSNITMTFGKKAFQNKTNLQTVSFHANEGQTSNASMPMLLTIPDSAFVGCTNLRELNLILQTDKNGTRALGPENFILGGDSIFAGLDSTKFHIVIDEDRKQDFLDNESWAPLKRFFTYDRAVPNTPLREYGASYAYAYENNSIKKEHKSGGHLIEHTFVAGMDERDYYGFCQRHQGAVKLCNDIGSYNNYQLDYVAKKAFYGNTMLRTVSFTDLYGQAGIGDTYTGLDVTLQDYCFANCPNFVNLDLVYMKTDGKNELQPLTPQQVKIGKGVFDGSPARIKMMPQQVAWFEADSTWAKYKDRFMPCIIRKTDVGVYNALEDMRYYDPAATGYDDEYWNDYIDLARIAGAGFSWLDGRFHGNTDIRSFADFKYFESVGLDYVGDTWFEGCTNLSNIVLPSTIKYIGKWAFADCTSLREIEIPASVTSIGGAAFHRCTALNTIIVRGETPALLSGNEFDKHDGLKIYVPAAKVQEYKTAWSDYAQYIVSDADYKKVTRITTTGVGQVAGLLGLTPVKENSKIRYLEGNYAKYDSLTVSGPLNGDDIAVLRHLMGANAWESELTDGCLRYLNLWGAQLTKDDDNSYNGYGVDEYLEKDNWVGEYMFHNCNALESLVLPASVTEIGENTFQDARGLKRIAVGSSTTKYTRDLLQNLSGIEELVFLTDQFASSESSDPWEADIEAVYVQKSQLGDYMSDPALTRRTQNVMSVFEDDAVMRALADKEHYFPSEYLELESVKGIFADNTTITNFDEFKYFYKVNTLEDGVFKGCTKLERITIPDSVKYIGSNVFRQCYQLSDIYFNSDSVPTIADDAFKFQVDWFKDDFRIYVPKTLCKRYREAWPQYAQYINADNSRYSDDEIITVTVTAPNTLAQALGFTVTTDNRNPFTNRGETIEYITSARGDYSKYRKLKVVGPLSGADFSILRYLAGFCPWTNTRNYAGHLEYLDLYDATLVHSSWDVAPDCWLTLTHNNSTVFVGNDTLPSYALLQAYSLKTLILPRTCTTVRSRALQECEALEVLVIGDKTTDFNWDSLDDDAMLTRLYILTENKLQLTDDHWIVQMVDNNYSPTFDAFYVRPTLLDEYLSDKKYTRDRTRTNLISKGDFDEDESFCAFASHAAATIDDLTTVRSVDGWFDNHTGIKDMSLMAFTAVGELKAADFQKLTQLEKISLPMTLESMEDSLFAKSPNLRYVDMLMCDSTNIISKVSQTGFSKLGIDSLQTLVYVPASYGASDGTNIVVGDLGSTLHAKTFRLIDSRNYCVPYTFEAEKVVNTRSLIGKGKAYSAVLPYDVTLDTSKVKAYIPTDRDGSVLTLTEVTGGKMDAFMPYVIRMVAKKATLNSDEACEIKANTIPLITAENERQMVGYTMRGTLERINNKEAAEMGISMLVDGKWTPVPADTESAYIAPFRAYALESGGAAGAPLTMQFVDEDGTVTGVDTIRLLDNDGTERYYDLNGRELPDKPTQKGVYIHNGKKVVVK